MTIWSSVYTETDISLSSAPIMLNSNYKMHSKRYNTKRYNTHGKRYKIHGTRYEFGNCLANRAHSFERYLLCDCWVGLKKQITLG